MEFGVNDKDSGSGDYRTSVNFRDCVIRVSDRFPAMHVDTDEANAASIGRNTPRLHCEEVMPVSRLRVSETNGLNG